jgi:glucose dehydrogenase
MRFQNLLITTAVLCVASLATAQTKAKVDNGADWPMFNRDLGGTRYSPLKQINTKNVSTLKLAWSTPMRKEGGTGPTSEATPIVVNGVMYVPIANRIVAFEPETGKEIWGYEVPSGFPSRRSVTYWPGDSNNPPRIIFTAGRNMVALNARTGKIDPGFGKEGQVDLVIPYNSAPTIYKNTLFVGANVPEVNAADLPGNTRAYDARTGAKLWEFNSVPKNGEAGTETWGGDSWKVRTGVNNWGFYMTVDEEHQTLFTVFGSPASDFYGGDRPGNNLYGNSVVALDINSGKVKWHFQAVHHDIWDYDLPPAPAMIDVVVKGKKIQALAQTGKLGYMFILNRVTGEPVFGVKETPVPQSDVPGEHTSPTQPIPVKPPPFGRMNFSPADIVTAADTNEEHAAYCRDLAEKSGTLINKGPYTPWPYRAPGAPPVSAVMFPGAIGGVNWGGEAVDPKLGYVFVFSNEYASLGWVEKKPDGSSVPYDQASVMGNPFNSKFWQKKVDAQGRLMGESSWPCQRPPWGRLTAVNANTGEFAWQIPLGITEQLPEGKQKTGRIGFGGPIVTAGGLVFIGASNDRRFRAIDSRTGKELWITKLENSAISVPMTFMGKNGKQYVAVVAGGGGAGVTDPTPAGTDKLMVYALP